MAIGMTVTDILNQWDSYGVFSYVLPFLIIFAVTFGILQKSKIFGEEDKSKGINAILGLAIGLAALQFDFVSTFFATIFPRFGVGLAVLIVFLIFMGLFLKDPGANNKTIHNLGLVGIVVAVAVILWSISGWNFWGDRIGVSYWLGNYFWTIILLIVLGVLIWAVVRKSEDK